MLGKKPNRLSNTISISRIFAPEVKTELRLGASTQRRSHVGGSLNGSILGSTVHAGSWFAGKNGPRRMKPFCTLPVLFCVFGNVTVLNQFYKVLWIPIFSLHRSNKKRVMPVTNVLLHEETFFRHAQKESSVLQVDLFISSFPRNEAFLFSTFDLPATSILLFKALNRVIHQIKQTIFSYRSFPFIASASAFSLFSNHNEESR